MKRALSHFILLAACAFSLAGCGLFKSGGVTPRTFVLTPIQTLPPTSSTSTNIAIGIRLIKMPGYLSTKEFAVRRSADEIVYPDTLAWAERLDNAMQRVLAANLSALIPTDQVRFTLWDAKATAMQIDVSVEQFDVDYQGNAVLTAWWRVLSSDGQKVLGSGKFSETRQGPPPDKDPQGAVSSLSALAGALAEKLAQVIKEQTSTAEINHYHPWTS
jgi:uncharacterized lipoprotein YmbA